MLLWQFYACYIVSRKGILALCSAYVILYLSLWYWITSNNVCVHMSVSVCAYICLHIHALLKMINIVTQLCSLISTEKNIFYLIRIYDID